MAAQERELLTTLDALIAEETWQPADDASGARVPTRLFCAFETAYTYS